MLGAPTATAIFRQRVVVGVGELAVSNLPEVTLSTYALGSCVGVVAFDPVVHAGGILHLMLPDSHISPGRAAAKPAMFADRGLPLLLSQLSGLHADPQRLSLYVAGGASVLQGVDPFKIGDRNIEAVREYVRRHGLTVCGASLGGTINRTLHFEIGTGRLTLRLPDGIETTAELGQERIHP